MTVVSASHQLSELRPHKPPYFVGMGKEVGILGRKWSFPSDHLPIGFTVGNSIHFTSWNVLNSIYVNHVLENYQGLNPSTLTEENICLIDNEKLTVRDKHNAELITQMFTSCLYPRTVVALQECGLPFIHHLQSVLPSYIKMITSSDSAQDQTILLYNSERLDCLEEQIIPSPFRDKPLRTIINALFADKNSQESYRCLSAHLPYQPNSPAPQELGSHIAQQLSAISTAAPQALIVMGDMNRTEISIREALQQSGLTHFQQISPYPTFIPFQLDGTYTQSADFDHAFIFGDVAAKALSPEEVLPGLSAMTQLLT